MRISKNRIEDDSIEVRIKTRGRSCREWRRRFEKNKDAENFLFRLQRLIALDESYGPRYLDGTSYEDLLEEHANPNSKKEGLLRKFGEELDKWKKHKYSTFSPGWRANIDGYMKELADLSEMKISEITPELLDEIDFRLDDEGNGRKTINMKIGWIKSVLNFSAERKRITYNPVATYKFTKPPEPEIQFWEKEEAVSFLQFANNKYPKGSEYRGRYIAYAIALNAGPRAGEIWALRVRSIKKDRGVIALVEQFDIKDKDFRPLKGKEARTVPLNEDLCKDLMDYIGQLGIAGQELLFKRENGQPWDHDAMREIFIKDQEEWGGKRIKFHGLRHTAGTHMLAAGVSVKTVQEILGHKDISTTMRYVHLLADDVKKAGETFSFTEKKTQKKPPEPPPKAPSAGRKKSHLQLVV